MSCESLLIKKTPFAESDILATFFTKEFGKITAAAKNAASSRKRFGGRLEPFALLKVEIGATRSGGKILQYAETAKNFENLTKDMRIFLKANCVLEIIDAAFPEEGSPCETVFSEALKTFSAMNSGSGFSAMLNFQTASLQALGYGTDFSVCGGCGRENILRGVLVFPTGMFLCANCARNSGEKPSRKINRPDTADTPARAFENIKCLNFFFQYHMGKVLKSAKLLESMLEL